MSANDLGRPLLTGPLELSLRLFKPCDDLLAVIVAPAAYELACFIVVFVAQFLEALGHIVFRKRDFAELDNAVLPVIIRAQRVHGGTLSWR